MKYLKFVDLPDSLTVTLPVNGIINDERVITDMDGKTRETYVIRWYDANEVRTANFDKVTGEYLGESI